MTVLEQIASLIQEKIGLDPASVGPETVVTAVRRRIAACGADAPEAYLQHLLASQEEWTALIEEVVIPETWFFRDGAPFAFLREHVTGKGARAYAGRTIRILSVPCSTGEESYSIAMALLDAGLPDDRFQIDAVDISRRALALSRQAVYGPNSFRGEDLSFRDRYFEEVGGRYRLRLEVGRSVRFLHGNVLADDFLPGAAPYDMVFCRNLLIYLHPAARESAIRTLDRLLCSDGLLFAGHAETSHVLGPGFVRVSYPRSFAFRKAPVVDESASPTASAPSRKARWRVPRREPRPSAPESAPPAAAAMPADAAPAPAGLSGGDRAALLARAEDLADRGRLAEAVDLCEEIMQQHGAFADGYCLLGLICEARRDEERAEDSFTKALYLDPDHYQALVHLMLICERRGRAAQAAAFRRRAERVQRVGGGSKLGTGT